MMGKYLMRCDTCQYQQVFTGSSADEIIKKMDAAGWDQVADGAGLCPACFREQKRRERRVALGTAWVTQ